MKAYLYRAPKALHKDGKKQQLLIGTNAQDIKHTFIVKGVKEANQIAKQYNAQRWNYETTTGSQGPHNPTQGVRHEF